jgi:hypothetical protein
MLGFCAVEYLSYPYQSITHGFTYIFYPRLLASPLQSVIYTINPSKRRIVFVGIDSSYWAERLTEFLWRESVNPDCIALQSYDFVRSKYLISPNDIFVVF